MSKPALEFFPVASVAWIAAGPGVREGMLARDSDGVGLTRILRWEPGFDSTATGPASHAYVEEVLILAGSMYDVTLEQWFGAGEYACRPPGMVHGPWTSPE